MGFFHCVGPPFESLQSTNLRSLSLKTSLLLALASVKRVGDLQALSIRPAWNSGPTTPSSSWNRHGYIPKVLSTPFRAQVITLSLLLPSKEDRELSLLCPDRALAVSITEIVLLPAGPRLSTFARFITWKYRPYRPGSSLLKWAHIY